VNKSINMSKFIPPSKAMENLESLRRIKSRLEVRFNRYKEIETEEYIGGNGSVYYNVLKLETKKQWEERLR
jgi:hypothetical protein